MGCYDYRIEKKRVEALAELYEKETGEKTVLVEHLTGTKKWYTFDVVLTCKDEKFKPVT